MRLLPLLSSLRDPGPFGAGPAELLWEGSPHAGWSGAGRPQVEALHLAHPLGRPGLLEVLERARRPRWGEDFLVLPAEPGNSRAERSQFFRDLEIILELATGNGPRVALRPAPGGAPGLAGILREARALAVGFCWDGRLGDGLDAVSDRIHCAVGAAGDDLEPLRRLGYRWNLALPAEDPRAFRRAALALGAAGDAGNPEPGGPGLPEEEDCHEQR